MPIERIDVLSVEDQNTSIQEIKRMHIIILNAYENLRFYNVKKLWQDNLSVDMPDEEFISNIDTRELQLMFLYKHIGCFVHKDIVSAFVRMFIPTAALDQQVRHLGTQSNWFVLNKGAKIPNSDIKVPSGYNYLFSLELPNPKIMEEAIRRSGRLAARDFNDLKIVYSNKCATCGIEEGKLDHRIQQIVVLQQGHMNPRMPLTIANTIPQCQYCNQTYQNYFVFNEYGRVIAVNNPYVLLQSPKDVQDEMIKVLLEERNKK